MSEFYLIAALVVAGFSSTIANRFRLQVGLRPLVDAMVGVMLMGLALVWIMFHVGHGRS